MTRMFETLTDWLKANQERIDALVFDIDGVLLTGGRGAGAMSLLSGLRQRRIPYCLLTNDGNHSPEEKAHFLQTAGIGVAPAEIVSCGHGLTAMVKHRNLRGQRFFVMGDLGTPCYARTAGLRTTRDLEDLPACAGVIIGEENYDWESTLNGVVNFFIDHPEAPLICLNPDLYFPGKDGLIIHLGAGSVARLISRTLAAYGQPVTPLYLGKPHPAIFRYAHRLLEKRAARRIPAARMLMVGDNLDADIVGAKNAGFTSALMLTGITTPEMLAQSAVVPDLVFERL